MLAPTLPDLNTLDREALKALLLSQHDELIATQERLRSRENEIEHLKLLIAKLRRMQFGRKSEKVQRQIEQLELRLEDLEAKQVASQAKREPATSNLLIASKPARRPLPEHLPRETHKHEPAEAVCPDCGGGLRQLGEDVSEMLEYVPARFKVIRHVRPKLSCSACERIVQAPAPSRPIERGLAGRDCWRMCWSRSMPITCRCIASRRSTRAKAWSWSARRWRTGWAEQLVVGPLVEVLRRYVFDCGKLHADDTPVPVLAPGTGKTKTGRLWTYVRDDRPAGDTAAPAVWFAYSPDRKGEHPEQHLREFRGTLQADAYAGFNELYEGGRIQEAACWAHVRRKFYDLQQAHASPIATEAMERIGQLYGIESEIRGRPPKERREVRQSRARPLLESLHEWLESCLPKLSRKSDTAAAIRYALALWHALMRYSTMAASRSTTTPPNGRCALSLWAGRTICSPARMPAANAPPRSTA